MIREHLFWWTLTMACLLWYCTITVYVAIKGASDIKEMLIRLGRKSADSSGGCARKENQS